MFKQILLLSLLFIFGSICNTALACSFTCHPGENLLCNGNFENGNTGFTTQYTLSTNINSSGSYFISNSSPLGYISTEDHTSGNGNMLLVNGSSNKNPKLTLWEESIDVSKNTKYDFEGWISALSNNSPPVLSVIINDKVIKTIVFSKKTWTKDDWISFTLTWYSGNSSIANISIIDKNTKAYGNDFALDDLSFRQQKVCVNPVPEPSSLFMGLLGLIGLLFKGKGKLS